MFVFLFLWVAVIHLKEEVDPLRLPIGVNSGRGASACDLPCGEPSNDQNLKP